MRTNNKKEPAGEAALAAAIEEWSKTLQDIGADLYIRAFENRGIASLSMVKFRYFELIARNPGMTPAELASRMRVSRPTAAAVIGGFIRQGLVRKILSETDGRVSHLFPTRAAQEIVDYRRSMYRLMARRIGAVLDGAERESLVRMMAKVVRDGKAEGTGIRTASGGRHGRVDLAEAHAPAGERRDRH
jgi:DNA-binding MarR family transcriptional regulator